jgi:hypothetical protein
LLSTQNVVSLIIEVRVTSEVLAPEHIVCVNDVLLTVGTYVMVTKAWFDVKSVKSLIL